MKSSLATTLYADKDTEHFGHLLRFTSPCLQSAEILILSCLNRCLLSVLSTSIPGWKIETLKNYQYKKNDVFKNLVSKLPSGPLSGLLRNVITRVDVLPNIFQVKNL